MECRRIAHTLPWFVNGTLEVSEQKQVEEHLAGCEDCRRELRETRTAFAIFGQHLPSETLVDVGLGRADLGVSRGLVESHLAHCPDCSEQLALVLESQEALDLEPEPAEATVSPPRLAPVVAMPPRQPVRERWRWVAVAASVAWAVASAGWLWSWRQEGSGRNLRMDLESQVLTLEQELEDQRQSSVPSTEHQRLQGELEEVKQARAVLETRVAELVSPQPDVSIVDLFPQQLTQRGGGDSEATGISSGAGRVTLILHSELRRRRVRAQLLDDKEDVLWQGDLVLDSTDPFYSLSLDPQNLPRGLLTLGLYVPGTVEPAETYPFDNR